MDSTEFHRFHLVGSETLSAEERTDKAIIRRS